MHRLFSFGVILLLALIALTACGTASTPAPQLPKHAVAEIMYDPLDWYPAENKWEKPVLLIVVDDWRHFTESDAWHLGNYYLDQYSKANPLGVDFLCDYTFASKEAYVKTTDTLYYPHVLYLYTGPYTGRFKEDNRPAILETSSEHSSFRTACK